MTKLYTTSSFLRDNGPVFDKLINKFNNITKRFNSYGVKVLNSNLEVSVVEILLQIPIFLFILILGLFIVLALTNKLEPEKGYRFSTILTSSMTPAISSGSLVLLSPPNNLRVGDIVSFKETSVISKNDTGRKLIHRIIDIKERDGGNVVITKGDANVAPDPGSVDISEIYGKVIFTIPYLGFLGLLLQSGWGLGLFVFIPVSLLIYSEANVIKKLLFNNKSKV